VLGLNPEYELLLTLLWIVGGVLIGFFFLGRALPVRIVVLIFCAGNAIVGFLAYRGYQSSVDYCIGSPEVRAGGDELSCLEPQHWFAIGLAFLVLLLAELGLATMLAGGLVRWQKQRRLRPQPHL
jgi:hypothetical protein